MTPQQRQIRQEIRQEISHYTRPIQMALCLVIMAIIGWGFLWRGVYLERKQRESQRVHDSR